MQTDRQPYTQTGRETDRQRGTHRGIHKQTDTHTDRQAGRNMRCADIQTGIHIDEEAHVHSHMINV